MITITPKKWGEFQHYKDRRPPWIKLQRTLLDDYDFACLPLASRALAPCLWLLASEFEGGQIPADLGLLAFRLHCPSDLVIDAVTPLIEKGFFVASAPLAWRKQETRLETEAQEQEQEQEQEKKQEPKAAVSPPADFKASLFSRWKALENGGGGAFIAKLFKDHKPDQRVLEAVERTLDHAPADPKAFVLGVLRKAAKVEDEYDALMRSVQ